MNDLHTQICRAIAALGGRAYLVGGYVRDRLLGLPSQDIDCEVHGLDKAALHHLLRRYGEVDTSGEVSIEQFDDTWVVEAPWLQRLIANVNFGDYESRNWFDRQLRESGLFDKLEAMGIHDGDIVSLYDLEFEYQR